MGLHTTIDPQLMTGHSAQASQETQYGPPPSEGSQQSVGGMAPGGPYAYSSPARPSYYREAGPSAPSQPLTASQSFQYLRSQSAVPPKVVPGASPQPQPLRPPITNGQRHSPFPDQPVGGEQYVADYHPQTAHSLAQLTAVADSLLGVCSSIKELLHQQVEESKARTEVMRAEAAAKSHSGGGGLPKEREKEISMEKVTFATEILKNGPQNEEIKKAAIECLTKYLMRDL